MFNTKMTKKPIKIKNSATGKIFQPCELSEILIPISSGHYQFRFPGQYSVCDPVSGNTSMGKGTPPIIYEKYQGNLDHIYGEPERALTASNEYYAIYFPNGLKLNSVGKTKSLRQIISEANENDPVVKAIKQDYEDNDPSGLDRVREYNNTFYQIDAPAVICFRKDNITENGIIIREIARPFQINPGEFLFY